jgi:Uma2 family endonuclease
MAAFPEPVLMTVEEFDQLPDREDVKLELHWGSLVELSRPKPWHIKLQLRIFELLKERSGPKWAVVIELPFRALPQYDFRAADVGVIAKDRWDAVGRGDVHGSPEIVIEILSPSNRRGEIAERASLFLSTGTQQFCIVDETRKIVRVTGPGSKTIAYSSGQEVPFPLLGASLSVDEIFA